MISCHVTYIFYYNLHVGRYKRISRNSVSYCVVFTSLVLLLHTSLGIETCSVLGRISRLCRSVGYKGFH
jgi:hypothetical protein